MHGVRPPHRDVQGALRAWSRGALLLLVLVMLVVPQALWRRVLPHRSPGPLPRWIHWLLCRLLGLRVQVVGQPVFEGVAAWVGNHLSYLDVPVVGRLGRMRFVAKQEVADWPLFGWLADLQCTVYVSRRARDAAVAIERFTEAVAAGGVVVLFAEGTSSDGSSVLPFRPSMLQALMAPAPIDAGSREGAVQAFTLRLRAVDGHVPDQSRIRDLYAYHGDAVLLSHIRRFLRLRGASVQVVFHPPVAPSTFLDRRALGSHLQRQVEWGLAHGTPAA